MPLERRDPIPPGRYAVTVFDAGAGPRAEQDQPAAWDAWLARAGERVRVVASERPPGERSTWYLVDVREPVPRWPLGTGLGLPDRVGPGVTSAQDMVQRPEPEAQGTLADQVLSAASSGVGRMVLYGSLAVALALVLSRPRR